MTTERLLPKPFFMRTKRKGNTGSPCLTPWEADKVEEGEPLIRIENKVEYRRERIQLTHTGIKPKSRIISLTFFQLRLLKDLDVSNFIRKLGSF